MLDLLLPLDAQELLQLGHDLDQVALPNSRNNESREARSFGSPYSWNPTGTAASMASKIPCRLSGKSEALKFVATAAIPQPMSTPTAAGLTAPFKLSLPRRSGVVL